MDSRPVLNLGSLGDPVAPSHVQEKEMFKRGKVTNLWIGDRYRYPVVVTEKSQISPKTTDLLKNFMNLNPFWCDIASGSRNPSF